MIQLYIHPLLFRLFSITGYYKTKSVWIFSWRLSPKLLRTEDQVWHAFQPLSYKYALKERVGGRWRKNMKIVFLAVWLWSWPVLPPEVCWQTDPSCEKSFVPWARVIYSLYSSLHPERRKGGSLGLTSDFTGETCPVLPLTFPTSITGSQEALSARWVGK